MEQLTEQYEMTINRKSKNAYWNGKPTKGFLQWNREQLRKGKTDIYAIKDKIYNPLTDSFITLKYKKSGTKNKILTKKSKNLIRSNNLAIPKYPFLKQVLEPKFKYNKIKLNSTNVEDDMVSSNTASWFKKIIKKKKLLNKETRWFIKNDKTNEIIVDAKLPSLTEKELNKYFREFNSFLQENQSPDSGIFWHYYLVYNSDVDYMYDTFTMFITEDINIERKQVKQYFAEGDYCLLKHIYSWIEDKIDEAKTNSTRKKYEAKKNKFMDITQKSGKVKIGYFTKYKEGIPQDDLAMLCNDLQIHVKIQKPFNEDIYLNIKSTKKPLRTFAYTNTKLNHVEFTEHVNYFNSIFTDNYKDDIVIKDSFTDMNEIKEELEEGEWIGTSTKHGYKTIKTLNYIYRLDDDFDITAKEFENEIGCNTESNSWSFDSIKYPELAKYIDCGTHFNGTIDFDDDLSIYDDMEENIKKGMKHFDQTKAYANFDKSKYYCGFMESPAEFRKVDNYNRKGFYLIDNIVIKNEKFELLNNKLNWFKNYNIYTDAELRALSEFATFDVLQGAMGCKVDFKFNKDMKEKKILLHKINGKEIKLPYYSKWVGRCAIDSKYQSFVMAGKKEYFENIKTDKTIITYNEFKNEAIIKYPKRSSKTLKHIAGQITAYQRLVMLEQLMKMDINKIVRVCVDGIYYWDHEVDFKSEYDNEDYKVWSDKTKIEKMTLNNSPTENYLSNIYDRNENINQIFELNNGVDKSTTLMDIIPTAKGKERKYYKTEAHIGAGGTGKTTINLLDEGLIDVCYIAPSWKLARRLQEDFKNKFNKHIDVNVYYRLVNEPYCNGIQKKYKNYILDEASQKTENEKKQLLKIDANKLIFVGDFGFQLPPVGKTGEKVIEMNLSGLDHIVEYNEQRRAKCKDLKKLLNCIRQLISAGAHYYQAIPLLNKYLPKITKEQLIKEYKKEDMILCSEHTFKDEYTEMFKKIEKYYVTENNSLYQNGMIIYENVKDVKCEKRHAYTIHSIQGETAEANLYIDLRKQKSLRMIYTAISRARFINQVKLI